MTVDAHANFAVSTVATAPSPATSGTSLVVGSGHGARFPATPFNAVIYPAGSLPDPTNAEVVRVTNRSTDTLTITRTQEGSSARTVVVGDQIVAAITKKTITDAEQYSAQINKRRGSNATVLETCDPNVVRDSTVAIGATGVMFNQAIWLPEGAVITSLCTRSGGVAAVTPTHWWFALYDGQATPALIGQTADQTTTAWAATTTKDLALTGGPFTITAAQAGWGYWSIMMTAATIVQLNGQTNGSSIGTILAGLISGMLAESSTSGSALTTTAPGTIASPTASDRFFYALAH